VDFKKPVLYSGTLMLIGYGLLVSTGEIDNPSVHNLKNSFRRGARLDDDPPHYNYVLHPLWGSETYLRAREANFGIIGSIGFSFSASFVWEYLIESWSSHPSRTDLIVTPGIGWIIGEARYKLKNASEREAHWLIDPINTFLECLNIGVIKDSSGKNKPIVTAKWNF
jgi:hypothetical protein